MGRYATSIHGWYLSLRCTVAVIPELLETGPDKGKELRKTITQFAAMFTGAGIMLA